MESAVVLQRLIRKNGKPVKGKNNKLVEKGILVNVTLDVVGNNNKIIINRGAMLTDMLIYIRGNNHLIDIRENCALRGGEIWIEDESSVLEIGKFTTIESAHIAITEPNRKIIIGEDCMFSSDIEFRTGDSHSIIDIDMNKRINYAKDIVVEDHVWLGRKTTVLKGVTIGKNSIVATNSVVTKDILPHTINGGAPAKVLKHNVNWVRERI